MDPNHSIRFDLCVDAESDYDGKPNTDSESHSFETCDFGRLCEWSSRFMGEGFKLRLSLTLRSNEAIKKFLHFWAQHGVELSNIEAAARKAKEEKSENQANV